MKLIILGQPRSGKSTLANMISRELNIPVICTDKYRREWGFHEPWKGYETEIAPEKQKDFYNKILELYNSYSDIILEGSAINPKDLKFFKYDSAVLLSRTKIIPEEMLKLSRKYDKDWTVKRNDKYLLKLFSNYYEYSKKWVAENPSIVVDTSDYFNGIKKARKILIDTIKEKEGYEER